jgi:hypothetical protein
MIGSLRQSFVEEKAYFGFELKNILDFQPPGCTVFGRDDVITRMTITSHGRELLAGRRSTALIHR